MTTRVNFAHLPTPIEALPRLSKHLGGPRLLVKRDDQTGLAFGGNKTRKLEFLIGEAQALGAQMLITTGAVQSNHCRQTAAAAAKFGFNCTLILSGERPKQASANLLLDHLFNAKLVWVTHPAERNHVLQETFEQAKKEGKQPYLVPYGGSSPTGALGYVYAMEEFIHQNVSVDWIIFPSSSGGTQAGLLLGSNLFGFQGKILGISVDEPREVLQERVGKLARATSTLVGRSIDFSPEHIRVNTDYCAPGYGMLTEAEREAIGLFSQYEGLLIDPVYTGRAAAGMIDLIRKGFFNRDETVLFWHTGGTPALFAEKYQPHILSN